MDVKIIMMIGIPGSGKSYHAKKIAKKENAIILSTDEIRVKLFGTELKQRKTREVYKYLINETEKYISQGKNVLIDATNIERNRRLKILNKFRNIEKECYYMDTPYDICLVRNKNRNRIVSEFIMNKMRKNLEIPLISEGFKHINIIHYNKSYNINKEDFLKSINKYDYDDVYDNLKNISIFQAIYKFNQENPFHKYLLCEHTYNVLSYINELYEGENKLDLQVAAILHDTGKPFCKTYKKLKGYYSYFKHENVSAQIALHFLKELDFDDSFILNVVGLIQMHMEIHFGGHFERSKIYHLLGENLLSELYFFREADEFGK